MKETIRRAKECFNPLDRGNLNQMTSKSLEDFKQSLFQSPKSGKFESNKKKLLKRVTPHSVSFNPLDRGNLNQILLQSSGNTNLRKAWFQSPRSGKFESNLNPGINRFTDEEMFQSPRSGKFESNDALCSSLVIYGKLFQSPRSGKFESN